MSDHESINNRDSAKHVERGELVVLIHGLAANRFVMRPLERRLRRCGYTTANFGYRSALSPIQPHVERFRRRLADLASQDEVRQLHIVGHSMGTIITRCVLADEPPPRLGRVVMLAPPNRGSRVARWLNYGFGYVWPPLSQLSDSPESFVNKLEHGLCAPCGVIAARRDRMVSLESTHLDGQCDHVVFNAGHTSMLFYPEVAELVARFLRTGRFADSALTEPTGRPLQQPAAP